MNATAYALYMEDGSPLSTESLPAPVRSALLQIEEAQRQGATTIGSADDSFTRRYVLAEHGIAYLPELLRKTTPAAVAIVVLAILAFAGILAGVIRIIADDEWAPAYLAAGAAFGWLMLRIMGRDARRTLARRDGIERVGVYLLPSALVLREPEACHVIPHENIQCFEYVPNNTDSMVDVFVNVVYRDPNGTPQRRRLAQGTQLQPLLHLFDHWLTHPTAALSAS